MRQVVKFAYNGFFFRHYYYACIKWIIHVCCRSKFNLFHKMHTNFLGQYLISLEYWLNFKPLIAFTSVYNTTVIRSQHQSSFWYTNFHLPTFYCQKINQMSNVFLLNLWHILNNTIKRTTWNLSNWLL